MVIIEIIIVVISISLHRSDFWSRKCSFSLNWNVSIQSRKANAYWEISIVEFIANFYIPVKPLSNGREHWMDMINTHNGKYYMAAGWGREAGDAEQQLGGGAGTDALHHLEGADPPLQTAVIMRWGGPLLPHLFIFLNSVRNPSFHVTSPHFQTWFTFETELRPYLGAIPTSRPTQWSRLWHLPAWASPRDLPCQKPSLLNQTHLLKEYLSWV